MKAPLVTDDRSLKEKNQYYGLIDGVRPIDHQDTYYVLNKSRCMKSAVQEVVYIRDRHPWKRLCVECYVERGEPNNFNMDTAWHLLCSPLNGVPLDLKLRCAGCKKLVMRFENAWTCRECIEQFLMLKVVFELEEHYNQNFEIEVNIRTH